jgi:hypothetical protein
MSLGVHAIASPQGDCPMKRVCAALAVVLLCSATAIAGVLPGVNNQKWHSAFTGGSEIYADGEIFSLFKVDSPFDSRGTITSPSLYNETHPGQVADFEIPTYGNGTQQVFGALYNVQLSSVFRASTSTWISGAGLIGYTPAEGDVQFFHGVTGASGGTFDVVLSGPAATTAAQFTMETTNPATRITTPLSFAVTDGDGTVLSTANSDLLLRGELEAFNGIGITTLYGVDLTSIGAVGAGANSAILAQRFLDGDTTVIDRAFNVDFIGGIELGSVLPGGMAVQNGSLGSPATGFTVDLRAQAILSPNVNNSLTQFDVFVSSGSFEYVSTPEPASMLVWAGLATLVGGVGVIRRRK